MFLYMIKSSSYLEVKTDIFSVSKYVKTFERSWNFIFQQNTINYLNLNRNSGMEDVSLSLTKFPYLVLQHGAVLAALQNEFGH